MTLTIGDKELKIKYGYEATLKSHIFSRLGSVEDSANGGENLDGVEAMLLMLPEMLLVGLQKYHKDEYGYDYDDEDSKQEQVEKMFALIDEYLDDDNNDVINLYQSLTEEMTSNGFLKNALQQAQRTTKKKTTAKN